VGLGFGTISGAFSLINVLADSVGPGTVGFHGESQNFFMVSAALALAMILCHTCWGVIAFAAMDDRKYAWVAFVWAAHFLVSCLVSGFADNLNVLKVMSRKFCLRLFGWNDFCKTFN
jgi:gamma-secretase subunit APH-1